MLKRFGDRFWLILCVVLIVGIFWFNLSSAVDVSSGVVFGDALGYWRSKDLGSFSNLVYGDGSESFRQLVVGFEKSVTKKHLPDLLSVCNKRSGLIFLGKRGIGEATQYFYVYSRNSNISMEEVFSWLN